MFVDKNKFEDNKKDDFTEFIKKSSQYAIEFNKLMDSRMKNTPLNMGKQIAEFYKTYKINLED